MRNSEPQIPVQFKLPSRQQASNFNRPTLSQSAPFKVCGAEYIQNMFARFRLLTFGALQLLNYYAIFHQKQITRQFFIPFRKLITHPA